MEDPTAEQPLLDEDGSIPKNQTIKGRNWHRLLAFIGVLLVLCGASYMIVSSQITRIATNAIKDTAMQIERMDLSQPHSSSVTLNISLRFVAASPFPAQVESAMCTIMYEGHKIGTFQIPSMTIRHGPTSQIFPNSILQIEDAKAWDRFAGDIMRLDTVQYEISSKLNIHVRLLQGLIKFSALAIPLKKMMIFNGMGGLKDMEIAQVEMQHSTQKQVLATIKTCVRNPSVTTIRPIGALCLHAHYPKLGHKTLVAYLTTSAETGLPIADGQASHPYCASLARKTNMTTGYNLLELKGEMLGINPNAISGLITKYLSNMSAELIVVTCRAKATSVDIYNKAMENLTIASLLPPQKDLLVGNMFFSKIALHAPETVKVNDIVRLDTAVLAEAMSPLGPNSVLTISDIHLNVSLIGAGKSLGTLSTLSADIRNGSLVGRSNISVDCLTELRLADNGKAFGRFIRASVIKKEIMLTLHGSIEVACHGALGTLKLYGLPLHTHTLLQGMNHFQNVTVKSFTLPGTGSASDNKESILTQVEVLNPSIFTVSLGTFVMDLSLFASQEKMGVLHGKMNLAPGMNTLDMNGYLQPNKNTAGEVSTAVAEFFSHYLGGYSSRVIVTVKGTQYHNCIWMQEALVGLTIGTSFPGVGKGFKMIQNINLNRLDVILNQKPLDKRASMTNTRMLVRTDMRGQVKMPPSINIPLKIVNLSVALTLENEHGAPLGVLVSGRESCDFNQTDAGAFRFKMKNFYTIGFENDENVREMSRFIQDLLTSNSSIIMRLASDDAANRGAFPDVETRIGMLALSNIPVVGAPLIPPMDSFRNPPVKVLHVDIQRGSPSSMMMRMMFSLFNPSIVQTKLGSLALHVFFEGARMGFAKISDFNLNCCGKQTVLSGNFVFQPQISDLATANRFLSNFVCGYYTHGAAQEIVIKGSASSTSLDLLQPAMKILTIPSKLPTMGDLFPAAPTLVSKSLLYIPSPFHLTQIPTSLQLRNPFSENITVTRVDVELYPCEDQVAENGGKLTCNKYFAKSLARFAPAIFEPIYIPAKKNSCYSCCQGYRCSDYVHLCPRASVSHCMNADIQSFFTPEAIAVIIHSLTGGLLMRINGTISALIGDYAAHLLYKQDGLLVTIAK